MSALANSSAGINSPQYQRPRKTRPVSFFVSVVMAGRGGSSGPPFPLVRYC